MNTIFMLGPPYPTVNPQNLRLVRSILMVEIMHCVPEWIFINYSSVCH